MEAPSKRMRLTVVVEALAEENAHGEYRDVALAAFKERKFAMPVQLDVTFEAVWADIEQRYKTNYLDPQQAATFSIKKLQDAYDCDLDMTDTVGDIFADEADVKMRVIKVIPHFIYRETSVVPGSMLRPRGAQKRAGEDGEDGANKRRRVVSQQRQSTHEARQFSPNRPIPSTESQQAVATGSVDTQALERSTRSKTGASLIELSRTEIGQAPFSRPAIKHEDPAPVQSPHLNGLEAASPDELTTHVLESTNGQRAHHERPSQQRTHTTREESLEAPLQPTGEEVPTVEEINGGELADAPLHIRPAQLDPHEVAIQQSPMSSIEPEAEPAPATRQRKDIYDVPNSPDFMQATITPGKPGRTYGRSPRAGATLLNNARDYDGFSENGTPASTAKTHASQRPQEVAAPATQPTSYTAGNEVDLEDVDLTAPFLDEAAAPSDPQTPARSVIIKPAKPGSLRKPSRTTLMSTPASAKRSAASKVATTPAMASPSSQSRLTFQPSPQQSTPLKTPVRRPSSSGKRSSVGSAPSQSVTESSKSKRAAAFKTPARKTPTPLSTQSPTGSAQEQPFECPICRKRFARIDNVTRHRKTHTNDRGHACFKCGQKFTRADLLSRHQKNEDGCAGRHLSFDTGSVNGGTQDTLMTKDNRGNSTPSRGENITPYLHNVNNVNAEPDDGPLVSHGGKSQGGRSAETSSVLTGDHGPSKSIPSVKAKISAKTDSATPHSASKSNRNRANQAPNTASYSKPMNGSIEASAAVSSSLDSPSAQNHIDEQNTVLVDGVHEAQGSTAEGRTQHIPGGSKRQDVEITQPAEEQLPHEKQGGRIDNPLTQDKPPSGQEAAGAARWSTQSWEFGHLNQEDHTNHKSPQHQPPAPAGAEMTPLTEDEGFAEQDPNTTALEGNNLRSRSASAAASIRSSPAVSRRPARFLSHSPTPDASESEDNAEEATNVKAPSPQVNNRQESESESDSSSDSSEDENVELPDVSNGRVTAADTQAEIPSSPPLGAVPAHTPSVPHSTQSTPSQLRRPIQQTPILPPTVQSSQALRSSQSVSVQAVDRRRYTGFRTLREQLADTKAAQATTQKKPFDPRNMSLGKLVKSTPLASLGGDDESSDDESSSSSSSDSD